MAAPSPMRRSWCVVRMSMNASRHPCTITNPHLLLLGQPFVGKKSRRGLPPPTPHHPPSCFSVSFDWSVDVDDAQFLLYHRAGEGGRGGGSYWRENDHRLPSALSRKEKQTNTTK